MTENKQQVSKDFNKKITDEKLKEEIVENDKSYKEIAHGYGYSFPSRALIRRIRELGFQKANKVSVNEYGSATFSVPGDELEKAVRKHDGLDKGDDDVFYIVRSNGEGDLVVKLSENPLVEKKDEAIE